MPARAPDPQTFSSLLRHALTGVCELGDAQVAELERHYRVLERWNARMNLTAIRSMKEAVVRHYAESLFLGRVVQDAGADGRRILDLGSGAGFPGIPLAVFLPSSQVTLLEGDQRKAAFLKESSRSMCNVTVISKRSDGVEGRWDWLVSRAVKAGDIAEAAVRIADHVGVLVAPEAALLKAEGIRWSPAVPLPWSKDSVVLVGDVSRGT